MHADERTRTVTHREWVLATPAHHTEVDKALAVAACKHDEEPGHPTDIVFTHGDGEIVIGYSVEGAPPTAGHTAAQWGVLRAELEETRGAAAKAAQDQAAQRRRADFHEATVTRVRRLAIDWSAVPGSEAHVWRSASGILHATLDEPDTAPRSEAQHEARVREFEDLLASIWLHIDWRAVTRHLTTEQRDLFAAAVEANCAALAESDPSYGTPAKVDRWWDE